MIFSGVFRTVLFCGALCLGCVPRTAWAQLDPSRALVVYNSTLPDSARVAREYATLRDIPAERVVGLECPSEETISRAVFEAKLRDPLVALMQRKGWMESQPASLQLNGQPRQVVVASQKSVDVIILAWGLPLRIDHAPALTEPAPDPRFASNAGAVDSELATIPIHGLPLIGGVPNPFFRATIRFGSALSRNMTLVARLDGPTPDMVLARLHEAQETEKRGLRGLAMFDSRGIMEGGYALGDEWMRACAERTRQAGMPTHLDIADALVAPSPEWNTLALYAGWYSEHAAGFVAGPDFRFRPGAVAYHIHSFSAATVRSPDSHWVGPLVARGAAATMGCVFEPYLQLTPHVDVFVDRLLRGWSFAEAAYAAQPWLSWMNAVVGDPFYAPFATRVTVGGRLR